jgi:hypothetical protein
LVHASETLARHRSKPKPAAIAHPKSQTQPVRTGPAGGQRKT